MSKTSEVVTGRSSSSRRRRRGGVEVGEERAMHFPYIVYCQYAPCIEIHFVTSSRINQCVRHARNILRTASIARDSDARTRVKETRKREGIRKTELKKMGGAWGQRERALSTACDSRQGLSFYVIMKYAPTRSFFLTVELLVSLAKGGGGEREKQTEKQLRDSRNTIERETKMEIKIEKEKEKEIDKENETKAKKRLPSLT